MTTPPLLLLSGAGLPSWIWDEVRATLLTPTRVVAYPRGSASLEEYAEAAAETADGWESYGVIAHSLGGVIGSELVAREPDRVTGFLGVAAIIPEAGESFLDGLPFLQRKNVSNVLDILGTRPPAKIIRRDLCAGIRRDETDRIVSEFATESVNVYRDQVSEKREFPATSGYVVTTKVRAYPVRLQKKYAAKVGGGIHRVRAGHLPMLQQASQLAGIIADTFEAD
ncbi:alpha/beta fold hydrolase [Nocardioides speluncae]|uniref:alpha/beta fold hydrolase n=1 Tax=Nocardioides speluncae TaxID=2670337 RepID=UPI0012B1830A|nr:alpha/beta hydrolase [Nocardioides speluncae]